jgi:hypothetical protein
VTDLDPSEPEAEEPTGAGPPWGLIPAEALAEWTDPRAGAEKPHCERPEELATARARAGPGDAQ